MKEDRLRKEALDKIDRLGMRCFIGAILLCGLACLAHELWLRWHQ